MYVLILNVIGHFLRNHFVQKRFVHVPINASIVQSAQVSTRRQSIDSFWVFDMLTTIDSF